MSLQGLVQLKMLETLEDETGCYYYEAKSFISSVDLPLNLAKKFSAFNLVSIQWSDFGRVVQCLWDLCP